MARTARPTLRCVRQDFKVSPLPPLEFDLGRLDHPMMAEAHRVAPMSPNGQKRVLAIRDQLVYRIRHGRQRGATWVDLKDDLLWLAAVEDREHGSRDDAFEYFAELHSRGCLLPNQDDRLRIRAERTAGVLVDIDSGVAALAAAIRSGNLTSWSGALGGIPTRVQVVRQDLVEIWVGVALVDLAGRGTPDRMRNYMFAKFEAELDPWEWEWRHDWCGQRLPHFELACLYIG